MKTYLDCIPCFLRQALEAARMVSDDEDVHRRVMNKVLDELKNSSLDDKKPPDIADRVHYMVRKAAGGVDPYEDLKREQNDSALDIYPRLKDIVARSDNRLYTAVKLTIAGNIIDIGPGHKIDIEKTVEEVLEKELVIDNYDNFRRSIESGKDIFILADNAGEIVFDKVLLEETTEKNITFFVKSGPILNDAMEKDARYVGIDELAEVDVVSNGMPSSAPKRDSEEFIERMSEADMIISKGQGNYEALSEVDTNIFFLLQAKCPVIADDIGVDVGDLILK
ncbi:MAG: ARMT1-like domain-containing protein [Candidatus Saliniplasma sp.]